MSSPSSTTVALTDEPMAGVSPAAPIPYFQPLDIVRFLAAVLILITHSYDHWTDVPRIAAATTGPDGQPAWWALKLKVFVGSFNIGVDIFFLMSGFLITYLLLVEKQRYGRIDIKSFYMRRVLRIWPLYYFCVAMAPVLTHFAHEPAANMPMHLLFLGNFDLMKNGWGSTAVNHLWSICIEEHFYLVWPLLIAFVPRPKLTTVFGAVILLSFLTRIYYFYFEPGTYNTLYLHTLCRWDALAIGSLFAYAHFHGYGLPRVPAAMRWMLYGATLLVFANDAYGNWDNIFLLSFKKYVFLGVIAFFIGNVLFNPDSAVQWRGRTIFHYFGKISYGIYMFHGFVIFALVRAFPMFHTSFFIGWVLLFTLIISAASYELVEKPILRLKKYFDAFRQQRAKLREPEPAPAVPV
ncbi:acyltransferase [Hymenobacter segetis]|uniref:Acyltransferase n=1 Tax=Hymenobacter segetis TaxID=2025509 RepID=A0ABU9M010_9BACT